MAGRRQTGRDRGRYGSGVVAPKKTLALETFQASGTWTSPAKFWHPDGSANAAQVELWGAGGGGTDNTGGGGGGAYSRAKVTGLAPSTGYAVGIGAPTATNTNGADATFATTVVVAKGGLSGGNGGTGGQASASTGDVKYSGGNGSLGAGSQNGGGSPGSLGAASNNVAGEPEGANGVSTVSNAFGTGGGVNSGSGVIATRGAGRITYDQVATPGFPRVRGRAASRSTGTSHVVTMPSGIVSGERLILVVASDGTPTITAPGDWTKVGQASEATSQVTIALFHKAAAGSDSCTLTTDGNEALSMHTWRIADAGVPEWTTAQADSGNGDCPSHTPSGGSQKYLWIGAMAFDGIAMSNMDSPPTGYSAFLYTPAAISSGAHLVTMERFLEAASDDPGAISNRSEQWAAATISVPPL